MPQTYVVSLLRGLWAGEEWEAHLLEVAVRATMLVVGMTVSVKAFRWE